MVRPVKKELRVRESVEAGNVVNMQASAMDRQGVLERRILRSQYLAVKNLISNERDDITRQDSKRFKSIIKEVEALHQNVKRPREQVADAETLLDIASTLATSVRSQNNEGVTPSDIVTALLNNFGDLEQRAQVDNSPNKIFWESIGKRVSHIFKTVPGCCTMIGPMSNEIKQRKPTVFRKRTKPTESTRPEEIDCKVKETKTDTDSNMSTMFDILKKKRKVHLENILLNRLSFAQTVENIFALSFLVKDGRAEITVDDNGFHLVSPRNAPTASAVASGAVSYHHFVFRFDFKDWKAMMDAMRPGDELMPHRNCSDRLPSQANVFHRNDAQCNDAAASCSIQPDNTHYTPIRKLTRNRGLVIQEDSIVEDSLEKEQPSHESMATSSSLKGFGYRSQRLIQNPPRSQGTLVLSRDRGSLLGILCRL